MPAGTVAAVTPGHRWVEPNRALLAEVRASRKTAKLRLRELAPTVLASPSPVGVVLSTLRAAGFLPAEDGPDGAVSLTRAEPKRASGGEQA